MKKVLIIGSFPAPYRVEVFKGIGTQYNADVFFITDENQNRSKGYFVRQNQFQYSLIDSPIGKEKFKKCCRNIKQYDFVIAYDWYLTPALLVELLCVFFHIPYFINCDGAFLDDNKEKIGIKRGVKTFFIRHASRCFASGQYAKKYLVYYGALEKNIVLHKFTSLEKEDILYKPLSDEEKIEQRKKLGLCEKRMVLSVGQFIYRKGYDILLEAWKYLDEEYQLIIIGGGVEIQNYRKLISKNELNNVCLIEYLPKKKVYEYYLAADLFVLPTREDIWGLVINEAMANALPVVATDRCIAALEMVKKNGTIVPVDDLQSLSIAIKNILQNDAVRHVMEEESLNRISKYTVDRIWKSHIETIEEALNGVMR